jgi:hypothetical protein
MPTLTYPATIVGGTTEDVSQLNSNLTAIQNVVNALDDANISATAGIQQSKLANGATGMAIGAFSAYRNLAVSLATGAVVPFDTEEFDVSSWHDVTTNVGRYTPQVAGYYRLSWAVHASGVLTADVYWRAMLRKNGALAKYGQTNFQRGAVASVDSVGTTVVQANGTTDFFDVAIEHGVGAAQAILVGAANTHFEGEMVGRS